MYRFLYLFSLILAGSVLLPGQQAGWTMINWRITAEARSFQSTFFEAIDKSSAAGVKAIEGYAGQKVSPALARNLDWNLAPADITAVRQKLRAAGVTMSSYYAPDFPTDEAEARKLLQFAKALGIETVVAAPPVSQLPSIDKLAGEIGVNVALLSGDPKSEMQAIEGRGKRLGICADTGDWTRANIKPVEALRLVKDRVLTFHLHDLNRAGAAMNDFLWEVYRLGIKPTALAIELPPSADPSAQLQQANAYLEKTTTAVLGDLMDDLSKKTPTRFNLTDANRQKVEDAAPTKALVTPKKPRKVLIIDMQAAYGGHGSLPYANTAFKAMAQKTGAFEAVFNNDFANLRYDKLRQYDALWLQNTVGPIFNSQEVRDGILRYVREGGGLGGQHGTGRASLDWPEFADMLGGYCGPHTVADEKVTIHIEDPSSPLTASFGGKPFAWTDEFFRFPTPPYTREKLHILLTIDASQTDMKQYTCAGCLREDNDYAVSWIREYGKGRVFYSVLGHQANDYSTPFLMEHFLAGIQYIAGDLDADSTPSARLTPKQ
jgi:type 1 glutamine amidotransferase/sugar phosphate isomerase/epimerase